MATTYTIKKGDTLSKIAKRMGTTVAELAELNGIANVNKIRAGATIKLPTEAPIPASRTRALDVARTRYAYPTDPYVAPKPATPKKPVEGVKIPVVRKVETPAEQSARMFKEAEALLVEERARATAAARDLGDTLGPRDDTLRYALPPNRSSANPRNVDGIPLEKLTVPPIVFDNSDGIWDRLRLDQQEQKAKEGAGNYTSGLDKLISMGGKVDGSADGRVRVADNTRSPTLTASDTEMLVYTLLGEAEGEGTDGMRAVASTIVNRTRAEGFPDDPVSVVSAPKQFDGGPGTPRYEKVKALYPPGSDEYAQAMRVVASHIAAPNPPDATGVGAVFFDTSGTAQQKYAGGTTTRIGNHFFYAAPKAAEQKQQTALEAIAEATAVERVLQAQGETAAIRKGALSPELLGVLSSVGEKLDVYFEVTSGGQKERSPFTKYGVDYTGSTRHDNGNAADTKAFTLNEDGSRHYLDFSDPTDREKWGQIAQLAVAAGAKGIGAAPDYMGTKTMHIGFGSPGVWGGGGKSVNAPEWLREAYAVGLATPPDVATGYAPPLPRRRPDSTAQMLTDDRAEAIAYARENARQAVLASLKAMQAPQEIDISAAPTSGFETNIWGNGIEGLFDEIGQPSSVPPPALTRDFATAADAGLLTSPQSPMITAAPAPFVSEDRPKAADFESARMWREALALRDVERARRAEESAVVSDQRMVSRYGRTMPVTRLATPTLESLVAGRPDPPVGSIPAARYVPVVAGREERAGSMPAAEGAAFATSVDAGLLSAPQLPVPMDTVDVQVGSIAMPRPRPATVYQPYVYQIDVAKAAATVREHAASQAFGLGSIALFGKDDNAIVAMIFEQKDKGGNPMIPADVVYDKKTQTVTTSNREYAAIIGGLNEGVPPEAIPQLDKFVRPILTQTAGGFTVVGPIAAPVVRPIVLQRKTVPIATIKEMMSSLEPKPVAKPKPPSMATVKPAWGASQPDLVLKAPGRTPQPGNPKTVGDAAKRTPVVETWSPMAAAKPVAPVYKIVPAVYKTVPVVPPAGKVASGAYNVTPEQRAAFGGTDAKSAAVVAKAANGTQISAAPAAPAVPAQPQTKRVLVTPAKRIAVSPGGGITVPERRVVQSEPKRYTAGGRTYVVKDGMMVNEKTGVKYARTAVYGEGGGDYGSSPGQSTAGLKPGDRVYNADTNTWGLKR